MAKDYVKYGVYRKKPLRRHRFGKIIGLLIGLLILGLFFLLPHYKIRNKVQVGQQVDSRLKSKIEVPMPKPPEPEFDFYNILPQDNLSLTSPSIESKLSSENSGPASTEVPAASPPQKPVDSSISATPDQVALAIAEAKKQLAQEVNQLSHEVYILVLGNFSESYHAEQYQAQALLKGFPVRNKAHNVDGKTNYQLFMGPYASLALASQQQKRLNAAGIQAVLVQLESK